MLFKVDDWFGVSPCFCISCIYVRYIRGNWIKVINLFVLKTYAFDPLHVFAYIAKGCIITWNFHSSTSLLTRNWYILLFFNSLDCHLLLRTKNLSSERTLINNSITASTNNFNRIICQLSTFIGLLAAVFCIIYLERRIYSRITVWLRPKQRI